jgi:flagellar motility protein MotE (MotC chaperone)
MCFAGAFVFARLTKKAQVRGPSEPNQLSSAKHQAELRLPMPTENVIGALATDDGTMKKAMSAGSLSGTDKQLNYLVYEVQEKMRQYDSKLASLETREHRLQMAADALKKDIENLNNLRIELATTVTALKEERDKLLASRVEIAKAEKANMVKIAATYDRMDSTSAGKILSNMCAWFPPRGVPSQTQGGAAEPALSLSKGAGGNMDDAVKILYYMTERTKAKVLAELVSSEPGLAAVLCEKLKQVVEKQ